MPDTAQLNPQRDTPRAKSSGCFDADGLTMLRRSQIFRLLPRLLRAMTPLWIGSTTPCPVLLLSVSPKGSSARFFYVVLFSDSHNLPVFDIPNHRRKLWTASTAWRIALDSTGVDFSCVFASKRDRGRFLVPPDPAQLNP